jgi:hypothetical protein
LIGLGYSDTAYHRANTRRQQRRTIKSYLQCLYGESAISDANLDLREPTLTPEEEAELVAKELIELWDKAKARKTGRLGGKGNLQ